jgi:hypothetical protein
LTCERHFHPFSHTEGIGDGGEDKGGITKRGEIDEDGTVGKGGREVVGNGEGEPSLADAAGAGQGQERDGIVEQTRTGSGDLGGATDERRPRVGQGQGRDTIGEQLGHSGLLVYRCDDPGFHDADGQVACQGG